ncbi:MAG: hypothetical protein WBV82_32530 [Myxococcaceae bacterium]
MNVLVVYGRLYVDCLVKALRAIGRNLWTVVLPLLLGVIFAVAAMLLGGLGGLIGGILLGLVQSAVISAYLYFVGELVSGSKVSLSELKRSFGAYFWSVLNLFFVFWVARLLIVLLLQKPELVLVLTAVAAFAFNAAPEVIYQRRTYGGLQTLQESWSFLGENWLPWFVPNLPMIAGLLALTSLSPLSGLISWLVLGPIAHVAMVFRGFLFRELAGSSHRQRMFRYRNA